MLRYNPQRNRLELINIYDEVIAVYPPEAIDEAEQAEGVEALPVDPQTKAAFDRYRQGDAAATEPLGQAIAAFNQQTYQGLQSAAQRGQTASSPAAQRPGERVGILQTPEWLNAQLNVAELALSAADAEEKFKLKVQGLVDAAQRVGMTHITPEAVAQMLAAPGAGLDGRLPATPDAIQMRLNAAQANDPAYINYIARLGGVTTTAEINRRQNVLDRLAAEVERQGRLQDVNEATRGNRAKFERDFRRAYEKARSDPNVSPEELSRMYWEYEEELKALIEDEWRAIERERPGFTAWMEQGAKNQIEALPPEQRAKYVGEGRPDYTLVAMGLRDVPVQPTDRDPNDLNMKVPTTLGAAQPQAPPSNVSAAGAPGPQGTGAPQKPAEPPPPGQQWVQENGVWVLRPVEEDDLNTVPTFALGGDFGMGFAGGGPGAITEGAPGQIGIPQDPVPGMMPGAPTTPTEAAAPPGPDPGVAPTGQPTEAAAPPAPQVAPTPNPAIEAEKQRQLEAIARGLEDAERAAAQSVWDLRMRAQEELASFQQQREAMEMEDMALRDGIGQQIAQIEASYQDALARLTQELRRLETQQRQVIAENPYAMGQFGRLELPQVVATQRQPGQVLTGYANRAPGTYTTGLSVFDDIKGDPRIPTSLGI